MFLKVNFQILILVVFKLISVLHGQEFSYQWADKNLNSDFLKELNWVQWVYPKNDPNIDCFSVQFIFQIIDNNPEDDTSSNSESDENSESTLVLHNMIANDGYDSFNYILEPTIYPNVFLIDDLSLDKFFLIIHKLYDWGGIILISFDDSENPEFSQILSAIIFSNNGVPHDLDKFPISCYLGQRDFQEFSLDCPSSKKFDGFEKNNNNSTRFLDNLLKSRLESQIII